MAKSISEEELQLRKRARRRLVGAIAVVAMVVIFLPMVLDNEPKPASQGDIDIKIPSPSGDSFISKIVPLGPTASQPQPQQSAVAPPSTPSAPPAAVTPIKQAESESPPPAVPAAKKATPAPKAVEKTKTAPKSKVATKGAGDFVVQVAALNDVAKAKQMEEQLAGAGIKAYTEVVATVKGKVMRVRVGPLKTREEAEKMRDKLKGMGLSGNIVPQ